ncbi:MAG: endonuclease/exonuclease/phosphatase family protein [Pirellulales bacterium]
MRKALFLIVPLALLAGGWYLAGQPGPEDLAGLGLRVPAASRGVVGEAPASNPAAPPVDRTGETIRIASFNIQVFGESKLANSAAVQVLVEVIRRFDVVAVQEIRAKRQDLLPRFVELINAGGGRYDYVIGPRLGRTSSKEQYAFIYNSARVECDRDSVYTVDDPDDLVHREPLVAAFRVRGPPADQAFTFTLVNIHTDPDEVHTELAMLDDVYRAVRDDGRREDDVILLGDLNADDRHLGELAQLPYIAWAVSGVPTNTRGTKLYDNIIFDARATTEFTGNAGVLDLLREFNLTIDQALAVSDHLPIWAEFDVYEGGASGRVAAQPDLHR